MSGRVVAASALTGFVLGWLLTLDGDARENELEADAGRFVVALSVFVAMLIGLVVVWRWAL